GVSKEQVVSMPLDTDGSVNTTALGAEVKGEAAQTAAGIKENVVKDITIEQGTITDNSDQAPGAGTDVRPDATVAPIEAPTVDERPLPHIASDAPAPVQPQGVAPISTERPGGTVESLSAQPAAPMPTLEPISGEYQKKAASLQAVPSQRVGEGALILAVDSVPAPTPEQQAAASEVRLAATNRTPVTAQMLLDAGVSKEQVVSMPLD
ncbi:hypothetical protein ACXWTF_13425, partial [Thiomicrolovo sp. ZZH C-3]